MHYKIITAFGGRAALTYIPAHSDIDDNLEITHRADAGGDISFHHGAVVDPEHHPTGFFTATPTAGVLGFDPGKLEFHGSSRHSLHSSLDRAVFSCIFTREEPPMHTGPVDAVSVPGLGDVDFAVVRPGERFAREKPKGRPDPGGAGQRDIGD